MATLIDKLRDLSGSPVPVSKATEAVPLDDQSLERLMRLLCVTQDDELSCEEVYNCLDEYVDCLASYQDVGGKRPRVEVHLSFCADCRAELEALLHALENADTDEKTA